MVWNFEPNKLLNKVPKSTILCIYCGKPKKALVHSNDPKNANKNVYMNSHEFKGKNA